MKILVIGSGAREHALCWKMAQSKKVKKLFCAPGNGGISEVAECVDINPEEIDLLLGFAKKEKIEFVVAGPEAPLVNGIVDRFSAEGIKIFGPDKYAAQLEGSKVFAKEMMARLGIPTAGFKVFKDASKAKKYIGEENRPFVVKADGLCAGKGVIVAASAEEAQAAADEMLSKKIFGPAGESIVIEEKLSGEEASIILVSDGKDFVTLASSQDHKRVFDNDRGPNTGGMGAYLPAPVVTKELGKKIEERIIRPLINGFRDNGTPYKGVLYVGVMVVDNEPYVLEFNVRFGDPETQAILPRLKADIVDIMEASVSGNIKSLKVEWDSRACVCVVCASGGYPGPYKKGLPIIGLDKASAVKDVVVFHAGTKIKNAGPGEYETTGGRVLGVTALGDDIKGAVDKAYEAVKLINFDGMHYRKDIGRRALAAR